MSTSTRRRAPGWRPSSESGCTSSRPGQLLDASTPFFTRDGDINQEDITNDAVSAWSAMRCWHFSLTDNPGVDHFALPSDPNLLRG